MAKILLADDDDSARRMMTRALSRAGHHVMAAADGGEAVKLAERQTFDLLITDLIMPGMEGIETMAEVRRLQPDIKVIATSGLGPSTNLQMAARLGAHLTLPKPFSHQDLVLAVERVLL